MAGAPCACGFVPIVAEHCLLSCFCGSSRIIVSTLLSLTKSLPKEDEKMIMSSKYTSRSWKIWSCRQLCIRHWKVAGALQSPNDIQLYLKRPKGVEKAVFSLSASSTATWLKSLARLIVENQLAPSRASRRLFYARQRVLILQRLCIQFMILHTGRETHPSWEQAPQERHMDCGFL